MFEHDMKHIQIVIFRIWSGLLIQEEFDIDLEENQGTIHAVKTEAHLHIPTASGEIIKIPLAAIQEPSPNIHNMNISNEVNKTGMWKHIALGTNQSSSAAAA